MKETLEVLLAKSCARGDVRFFLSVWQLLQDIVLKERRVQIFHDSDGDADEAEE